MVTVSSRAMSRLVGAVVLSAVLAGPVLVASPSPPTQASALPGRSSSRSRGFIVIRNEGQFAPEVRFQVRAHAEILWVTSTDIWITYLPPSHSGARRQVQSDQRSSAVSSLPPTGVNLRLSL